MAFLKTGLFRVSGLGSVGAGAGSVKSMWTYHTADDAATVETAGYFNSQAKLMAVGDIIFAVLLIGGAQVTKGYHVTANTGTVVTIAASTF